MQTEKKNLWESTPGMCEKVPTITSYIPEKITSDAAFVIFPGGGYNMVSDQLEGADYAEFLANNGYCAFVVDYRVRPHQFPLELLDARRAVRTVRHIADKYGINKNKIGVLGSSAGGNLAALVSTYYDKIDYEGIDEIDDEDFIPNAQILAYPVIMLYGDATHKESCENLMGDRWQQLYSKLSPDLIASEKTPQAFLWHTCEDGCVNVANSLEYVKSLKKAGVLSECHIFPNGYHGMGICSGDDKVSRYNAQWGGLLLNWLKFIDF